MRQLRLVRDTPPFYTPTPGVCLKNSDAVEATVASEGSGFGAVVGTSRVFTKRVVPSESIVGRTNFPLAET